MLCRGCGEMNNQFVCCGGLIKVKCACGKCRRHWIWGCQYSATTAATRVRRGIFRASAVDGLVVHVVHVLCVQPRPSPPARPAPPATCPSSRDARTPPPQPFCVRSRSFSPSTSAVSHAPNAVSGRIPSFHLCSPFCGTSRLATPPSNLSPLKTPPLPDTSPGYAPAPVPEAHRPGRSVKTWYVDHVLYGCTKTGQIAQSCPCCRSAVPWPAWLLFPASFPVLFGRRLDIQADPAFRL